MIRNKLITERFFATMERQLTNFPRMQLFKVREELKRERQARIAAELKTVEGNKQSFKVQQEVNRLKALVDKIQTKQLEQERIISTLKDNVKNAQEHLVDCFLKLHMPEDTAWYYACSITKNWELAKKLKNEAEVKEEALKQAKK